MAKDFDERWRRIGLIPSGQEIQNWSLLGRTRGSFTVAAIEPEAVIVKSDGINGERRVPKAYFEKVFNLWDAYRDGGVPRSEVTEITRNSTYILSILHWTDGA